MKKAVSIRLDDQLKQQAQAFAQSIGISFSSLVSGALTKIVKEKKVEFTELTVNGLTPEHEQALLNSVGRTDNIDCIIETDEDLKNYFQSVMQEK